MFRNGSSDCSSEGGSVFISTFITTITSLDPNASRSLGFSATPGVCSGTGHFADLILELIRSVEVLDLDQLPVKWGAYSTVAELCTRFAVFLLEPTN